MRLCFLFILPILCSCSLLDECIDKYDVYKVETIGDSYMVASGVPTPNGRNHAREIALMALRIQQEVKGYTISHMPGRTLQIRIGLNSGWFKIIILLNVSLSCCFVDFYSTFVDYLCCIARRMWMQRRSCYIQYFGYSKCLYTLPYLIKCVLSI